MQWRLPTESEWELILSATQLIPDDSSFSSLIAISVDSSLAGLSGPLLAAFTVEAFTEYEVGHSLPYDPCNCIEQLDELLYPNIPALPKLFVGAYLASDSSSRLRAISLFVRCLQGPSVPVFDVFQEYCKLDSIEAAYVYLEYRQMDAVEGFLEKNLDGFEFCADDDGMFITVPEDNSDSKFTPEFTLDELDDKIPEWTRSEEDRFDRRSFDPISPLSAGILLLYTDVQEHAVADSISRRARTRAAVVRLLGGSPCSASIMAEAELQFARMQSRNPKLLESYCVQLEELMNFLEYVEPDDFLRGFEFSWTLPIVRQQLRLADENFALGGIGPALMTYEDCNMWERVVKCRIALDDQHTAISLLRRLIEQEPADCATVSHLNLRCALAKLLMLTGTEGFNIVKDIETLSPNFSRAYREEAHYHLLHDNHAGAVEALTTALRINRFYPRHWFILGMSCLHLQRYAEAITAFRVRVEMEPSDSNAWGNLASCLIKTKQKDAAFVALRQAVQRATDVAELWEMYSVVAIDTGNPTDACFGLRQLIKTRPGHIDVPVYDALVTIYIENMPTKQGNGRDILRDYLPQLTTHLEKEGNFNAAFREVAARFWESHRAGGDPLKAAVRAVIELRNTPGWWRENSIRVRIVTACENLATLALEDEDRKAAKTAETTIAPLYTLLRRELPTHSHTQSLSILLDRLNI